MIEFLKNLLPKTTFELEKEADRKWEKVREKAKDNDVVVGYRGTHVAKGFRGYRRGIKHDIKVAEEYLEMLENE